MRTSFLFIIIVLLSTALHSQTDTTSSPTDTIPVLSLNINGCFVFNNAFSHFSESAISSNKFESTNYESIGPLLQLKPGFNIGVEVLMGQFDSRKLVLGVSLCRSGAKYHYIESAFSSGPSPYNSSQNIISYDASVESTMLNYEIGARFKLIKGLFIKNTLLVNQGISRFEKRTGQMVLDEWSNAPPPNPNYYDKTITEINSTVKVNSSSLEFSYRLGFEYDLTIKNKKIGLTIFRNFGLTMHLPWYGVGIAYYLIK